ncbi:hypothetical protein RHA1_ro05423 [Rhodococcus jostii RHA1]|uniref:Uncharacterized protein n=1 Tax=Rhodococcus jostii (strain RHA1) TaxID=101510 RepID=Q0S5I3_RHOJR|nr:hypothetical protein RHA1_ro05423 [Rhodococcus jostii RHA1]
MTQPFVIRVVYAHEPNWRVADLPVYDQLASGGPHPTAGAETPPSPDVERGFVLPSERELMDSGVWDTPSGMFIQFVSGVLHALNWGSVN